MSSNPYIFHYNSVNFGGIWLKFCVVSLCTLYSAQRLTTQNVSHQIAPQCTVPLCVRVSTCHVATLSPYCVLRCETVGVHTRGRGVLSQLLLCVCVKPVWFVFFFQPVEPGHCSLMSHPNKSPPLDPSRSISLVTWTTKCAHPTPTPQRAIYHYLLPLRRENH